MNTASIFEGLNKIEEGFWSATAHSAIAYPSSGNERCYQIEDNSFWFAHRNNMIAELVAQHRPTGTLFDIGGGNGFVALGLKNKGIDVALVEPGAEGARNAKARGVPLVIHSTLQDAGFPMQSLPGAGLFDVLEHIEDDLGFLQTLNSYLEPGAPLFLTVPAYQWLWSYEDTYAKHFRRYTLSSLSRILKQAGFTIQFQTYIFSFLIPPIFLTRTVPSTLGLRRSFSEEVCVKEHAGLTGTAKKVMDYLCDSELRKLRNKKPINFGGSCLISARKLI